MKKNGISRSHLFLIELIVTILFFAFACAVALMVFGKAHDLSNNTSALNGALTAVQNAAETNRLEDLSDLSEPSPVYFNKDWQVTDLNKADFTLTAELKLEDRPDGKMAVWTYTVVDKNQDLIYQLGAKKYYPEPSVIQDEVD